MVPEPRGVCALLVPWNDPIAIACGQLAACLATGNAVVLKPSEKTPLSTRRLVELLHAELPEGVLQLLLGDVRAGRPLAAHPASTSSSTRARWPRAARWRWPARRGCARRCSSSAARTR
jgi:succinate-semialdehyde dehydrogenase/glutarate-semialdehyde dehydrogenase